MAQRLSEKTVDRLGVRRSAYIVWDQTVGLGLKITPRGRRIWLAQLKYPGHNVQTRRTLGHYPALGLEAARTKAKEWYALAKAGIDPVEAEEALREKAEEARRAEALRRANTFAAVAKRYCADRAALRRAKADEAEIQRMLVKAWADRPIHTITPRDVRDLFAKLKVRAPYDARNAWTHVVGIFKHAVHQELIEASPCASLDKKLVFKGAKIAHRQRVLDEAEVFAFWRGAGRLGYPAGPFYRLLLLTGVRVSELGRAGWTELHPDLRRLLREAARSGERVDWAAVPAQVKQWTVPRERFKSDAEHRVPLSDDACAILEGLPRFAGCDYLFTFDGEKPAWIGTKHKRRLDARMLRTLRAQARKRGDDPAADRLANWIQHDLRRVVRTGMAALDVEDHVAEMVLGHARQGLQRIYDQHRYEPQIREAMERWAAKLRSIVEPPPAAPPAATNVVALAPKHRARR